ncbi:retrovirus-related pol polyprotein from transposon TNT 1-94, partial [Tanacetum coccineum]
TFKLDLVPLAPNVLNNRDARIDYIKHSREHAKTLREKVEHARALRPLDRMMSSNSANRSQPSGSIKKNRISWKPTGRTFTIDGNMCPLTRFTSTKVVSLKETTSKSVTTQNPQIKIDSRKSKITKSVGSSSKSKVVVSKISNNSEPNQYWGSNVSVVPSTSLVDFRLFKIFLWYLDSGCSKHMIGNTSQLINFVHKFLGTVRFGNDQIAKIMGYEDYQIGKVTISRVYYVEGLGHNLFFIGQFWDSDLEVAFPKHTCYIRDLEGVDLLKGSRGSNLYTLSLEDMMLSSTICLLYKASKTKSWLWHRRLSHLNFNYITTLAKQGLVHGLPRLKFKKDHLCAA